MAEDQGKTKFKKGTIKALSGFLILINLIWGGCFVASLTPTGPIMYAALFTGGLLALGALYLILDGLSSTD